MKSRQVADLGWDRALQAISLEVQLEQKRSASELDGIAPES